MGELHPHTQKALSQLHDSWEEGDSEDMEEIQASPPGKKRRIEDFGYGHLAQPQESKPIK